MKRLPLLILFLIAMPPLMAQTLDDLRHERERGIDSLRTVRAEWGKKYNEQYRLFAGQQRPTINKPKEQPSINADTMGSYSLQWERPPLGDSISRVVPEGWEVGRIGKVRQVQVPFYGRTCRFSVPSAPSLSQEEARFIAQQVAAEADRLQLGDWGQYLLTRNLSEHIYARHDKQSALTVQVMNALGYDARIGRLGKDLYVLVRTNHPLYGKPYLDDDGRLYYGIDLPTITSDAIIYSNGQHTHSLRPLDMHLHHSPLLDGETISGKHEMRMSKNLINFLSDYPMTDIAVHATAAMSKDVEKQIYRYFGSRLQGDTIGLLNTLLSYVQSFPYQTDQNQFGSERYLFCEELYYYPYSDCEDRAVLFTHLTKLFTDLDVVLLCYPNHVTTAVHIPHQIPNGHYVHIGGHHYYVCDPTFRGAKVGDIDTRFTSIKAQIIFTK